MIKNTIYKGDCLELMPKLLDDKSIDMIFCDLPYGTTKCKWDPMKAHENLLVFYKKPPIYNPQKTSGYERKVSKAEHKTNCKESEVYNKGQKLTTYDSTERYPRSVLTFASDKQKSKLHPTQKPLSLI